jgi:hypothetical protein
MQIREGAYYRTRGGDVVGPMCHGEPGSHFPWITLTRCWTMAGMVFRGEEGHKNCMDLISEVYVSDTPPENAPEVETLRDKFAIAALSALTGLMVNLKIEMPHDELADKVYRMADSMMEARKK